MKKSVFALLALATVAIVVSSCSKNDAGSNALNTSVSHQLDRHEDQPQVTVESNYNVVKVNLDSAILKKGADPVILDDGE